MKPLRFSWWVGAVDVGPFIHASRAFFRPEAPSTPRVGTWSDMDHVGWRIFRADRIVGNLRVRIYSRGWF